MLVTRVSPLTGKENTLDLPITEQQLIRYASGRYHVQNAFPGLTPAQREFIKTGYTQEDWDTIFKSMEK